MKRSADDFEREYRKALDVFAEAATLGRPISGDGDNRGSHAVFGDRLPTRYRRDA
jgi:hypothetical protein